MSFFSVKSLSCHSLIHIAQDAILFYKSKLCYFDVTFERAFLRISIPI